MEITVGDAPRTRRVGLSYDADEYIDEIVRNNRDWTWTDPLREGTAGIISSLRPSSMETERLKSLIGLTDEQFIDAVHSGMVERDEWPLGRMPQARRDAILQGKLAQRQQWDDTINEAVDYVAPTPHAEPEGWLENTGDFILSRVPSAGLGLAELAALGVGGATALNTTLGHRNKQEQVYDNLRAQGYSPAEARREAMEPLGNIADLGINAGTNYATISALRNLINLPNPIPVGTPSPIGQVLGNIGRAGMYSSAGTYARGRLTNARSNMEDNPIDLLKQSGGAALSTMGMGLLGMALNGRRLWELQREYYRNRPIEVDSWENPNNEPPMLGSGGEPLNPTPPSSPSSNPPAPSGQALALPAPEPNDIALGLDRYNTAITKRGFTPITSDSAPIDSFNEIRGAIQNGNITPDEAGNMLIEGGIAPEVAQLVINIPAETEPVPQTETINPNISTPASTTANYEPKNTNTSSLKYSQPAKRLIPQNSALTFEFNDGTLEIADPVTGEPVTVYVQHKPNSPYIEFSTAPRPVGDKNSTAYQVGAVQNAEGSIGAYEVRGNKFFTAPSLKNAHLFPVVQKAFTDNVSNFYVPYTPEENTDIPPIGEEQPIPTNEEDIPPIGDEPVSSILPEDENIPQAGSNTARIRTMKGTEADIRYRVVEADDLITSTNERGTLNPNYPQELQPRQRDREASFEQINRIANDIDPELLAEDRLASNGAPVIGRDMVVESGNGRVMALRQAYRTGKADGYRDWLYESAGRFGLDTSDFEGIRNPVLVRERISDVDRVKFASEANESNVANMSPTENAQEDARRITPEMLRMYDTDKALPANIAFLNAFMGIIPQSERGGYVQSNGTISRSGLERAQNALSALAYGDNNVLNRLSEFFDDDIRNVSNALVQAAPRLALLDNSGIRPEISIKDDTAQAVNTFANIKRQGRDVDEYLSQPDLFENDSISNEAVALLRFFDRNKRSAKKITQGLTNYADIASREAKYGQATIPGLEDSIRDKQSILRQALAQAEGQEYEDLSLRGSSAPSVSHKGSETTDRPRSLQDMLGEFKNAFDRLSRGGAAHSYELRNALGWPNRDFDNIVKMLRNDELIQTHNTDPSILSEGQRDNAYVDEDGNVVDLISWTGTQAPRVHSGMPSRRVNVNRGGMSIERPIVNRNEVERPRIHTLPLKDERLQPSERRGSIGRLTPKIVERMLHYPELAELANMVSKHSRPNVHSLNPMSKPNIHTLPLDDERLQPPKREKSNISPVTETDNDDDYREFENDGSKPFVPAEAIEDDGFVGQLNVRHFDKLYILDVFANLNKTPEEQQRYGRYIIELAYNGDVIAEYMPDTDEYMLSEKVYRIGWAREIEDTLRGNLKKIFKVANIRPDKTIPVDTSDEYEDTNTEEPVVKAPKPTNLTPFSTLENVHSESKPKTAASKGEAFIVKPPMSISKFRVTPMSDGTFKIEQILTSNGTDHLYDYAVFSNGAINKNSGKVSETDRYIEHEIKEYLARPQQDNSSTGDILETRNDNNDTFTIAEERDDDYGFVGNIELQDNKRNVLLDAYLHEQDNEEAVNVYGKYVIDILDDEGNDVGQYMPSVALFKPHPKTNKKELSGRISSVLKQNIDDIFNLAGINPEEGKAKPAGNTRTTAPKSPVKTDGEVTTDTFDKPFEFYSNGTNYKAVPEADHRLEIIKLYKDKDTVTGEVQLGLFFYGGKLHSLDVYGNERRLSQRDKAIEDSIIEYLNGGTDKPKPKAGVENTKPVAGKPNIIDTLKTITEGKLPEPVTDNTDTNTGETQPETVSEPVAEPKTPTTDNSSLTSTPLPKGVTLKNGTLEITYDGETQTLNVRGWAKNWHRRLYINTPNRTSANKKKELSIGYYDGNTGKFEDFNPKNAEFNNAVQQAFLEHINKFYEGGSATNTPIGGGTKSGDTKTKTTPEIQLTEEEETALAQGIIPSRFRLRGGTIDISGMKVPSGTHEGEVIPKSKGKFSVKKVSWHPLLRFSSEHQPNAYEYSKNSGNLERYRGYAGDNDFYEAIMPLVKSEFIKNIRKFFKPFPSKDEQTQEQPIQQPEEPYTDDTRVLEPEDDRIEGTENTYTPDTTEDITSEDNEDKESDIEEPVYKADTPYLQIAEEIKQRVLEVLEDTTKEITPISTRDLLDIADRAFGGTKGEGKYTPKDAYDAMELGINMAIRDYGNGEWFNVAATANGQELITMFEDLDRILQLIPTQTNRTEEQNTLQQFSTPPTLALLVNWLANIYPDQIVLEPSAGLGGLAVFANASGANLILNELSERRANLLDEMHLSVIDPNDADSLDGKAFRENAEHIHAILVKRMSEDDMPDRVIMNPPFSSTSGRTKQKDAHNASAHIEQAMNMLKDNGRLVAILSKSMSDDNPSFNSFWRHMRKKYNVVAIIKVDGSAYKKYGTTWGNIIAVIDKNGDTPEGGTVHYTFDGSFSDRHELANLINALAGVQADIPDAEQAMEDNDIEPDDLPDFRLTEADEDFLNHEEENYEEDEDEEDTDTEGVDDDDDIEPKHQRPLGRPAKTETDEGDADGRLVHEPPTRTNRPVNVKSTEDKPSKTTTSNPSNQNGIDLPQVSDDETDETVLSIARAEDKGEIVDILQNLSETELKELADSESIVVRDTSDKDKLISRIANTINDRFSKLAAGEEILISDAETLGFVIALNTPILKAWRAVRIPEGQKRLHNMPDGTKYTGKEIDAVMNDNLKMLLECENEEEMRALLDTADTLKTLHWMCDNAGVYIRPDVDNRKECIDALVKGALRYKESNSTTQPFKPKGESSTKTDSETDNQYTYETFKRAFDKLDEGDNLVNAWSLNKELGWPHDAFSELVNDLQEDGVISLYKAPKIDVIAYQDKDGKPYTDITWNKDRRSKPKSKPQTGSTKPVSKRLTQSKPKVGGKKKAEDTLPKGGRSVESIRNDTSPRVKIKFKSESALEEERIKDSKGETKEAKDIVDNDDINTPDTEEISVASHSRSPITGFGEHPGRLDESTAMAFVEYPEVSYIPLLPAEIQEKGLLSNEQMIPVIYAGEAFTHKNANGERRGYFIGDGTGVGKGREISGVIMDALAHGYGKGKAIWISDKHSLINDARRDWTGLGNDAEDIQPHEKMTDTKFKKMQQGILFSAYSYFSGAKSEGKMKQLKEWLGDDFDGVIVLDECHNVNNVIGKKSSVTAKKIKKFIQELPNARVLYVSATGATEAQNLAMLDRLGLWGNAHTPFASAEDFVAGISQGKLAGMELVARDLKAMGLYCARTLSMEGIQYDTLMVELNPHQIAIYDKLAECWQHILQNMEEALKILGGDNGDSKARGRAMMKFWSAHQRFFNQILLTLQTPATIKDIERNLDKDKSIVIQLTNTFEAAQEKAVQKLTEEQKNFTFKSRNGVTYNARLEPDKEHEVRYVIKPEGTRNPNEALGFIFDEGGLRKADERQNIDISKYGDIEAILRQHVEDTGQISYDDLDISPKQDILQFLNACFPVQLMEEIEDDNGKTIMVPVTDGSGNPVTDPEAERLRDELIEEVNSIKQFPESPLELLIDHFGADNIAEVTGRSRRFIRNEQGERVQDKRNSDIIQGEINDFNAGRRRILIFSEKGGTGASYHASRDYENQQQRRHYLFQPGWRSDKAMQGLGRTNRSNQAKLPEYVLVTTDIPGQKRFVSTIARRLQQLGALSTGERKSNTRGLFSEEDNLEQDYVSTAMIEMVTKLLRGYYPELNNPFEVLKQLGFKPEVFTAGNRSLPKVTQFLNRILSMTVDMQKKLFARFEEEIASIRDRLKNSGKLDMRTEEVRAQKIDILQEAVVYKSREYGTETKYLELELTRKNKIRTFDEVARKGASDFYIIQETGDIVAAIPHKKQGTDIETEEMSPIFTLYCIDPRRRAISVTENLLKNESLRQQRHYTKLSRSDAEQIWEQQASETSPTYTETKHMITGAILPIWKQFGESTVRVQKVKTSDGREFLGRLIEDKDIQTILSRLNIRYSSSKKYTAASLRKALDSPGMAATLSNNLKLKYVRVNGEKRLEILNHDFYLQRVLQENGAIAEIISGVKRLFIKNGDDSLLEMLLKNDFVTSIKPDDADGKSSNLYFIHPSFRFGAEPAFGAEDNPYINTQYAFSNPETEKRYQDSKKPKKQSALSIIREAVKNIYDGFRSDLPGLLDDDNLIYAQEQLRNLKRERKADIQETIQRLSLAIKDLTPDDFDLFSRAMQLMDLKETLDRDPEASLPWGFTIDDLYSEYDDIMREVDDNLRVSDAIDKAETLGHGLSNRLINAAEELQMFDIRDKLQRQHYFRHIVLDYYQQARGGVSKASVKNPNRRGYLKHREGSEKDILSDWITAMGEVWARMNGDIKILHTLKKLRDHYDIIEDLKQQAFLKNQENALYAVMTTLKDIPPEQMQAKASELLERQMLHKQAQSIARLFKLAEKGDLPLGHNREWAELVHNLAEAGSLESLNDYGRELLPRYIGWLAGKEKKSRARAAARRFLKGNLSKQAGLKKILGEKYVQWQDLIPDDYELWTPSDSRLVFSANTVPENVLMLAEENLDELLGIPLSEVGKALNSGGNKQLWCIPSKLAETLNELGKSQSQGLLARGMKKAMNAFKRWILLTPANGRLIKYNWRNFFGDFEAVLQGNPDALRYFKQAARELSSSMLRGGEASGMLAEFQKRGGGLTSEFINELENWEDLKEFVHLFEEKKTINPLKISVDMIKGYVKLASTLTNFRENILRYAAFLSYVKQIQDNNGEVPFYGMSKPKEVQALNEDIFDMAFKLSNENLGAYDQLSQNMQWLRNNSWLSFISFVEVNFKRHIQMYKNIWGGNSYLEYWIKKHGQDFMDKFAGGSGNGGNNKPPKGSNNRDFADDDDMSDSWAKKFSKRMRKIIGKSPVYALRFAITLALSAPLMLICAFFNWLNNDNEEKLTPAVRNTPHLTLWTNERTGEVMYLSRLGSAVDFFETIGLDGITRDVKDIWDGKMSAWELPGKIASGPVSKLVNNFNPFVKAAVEMLTGRRLYPDISHPSSIRDNYEYLASSFALDWYYDAITGKPHKPFSELSGSLANSQAPEQSAYWYILSKKREFEERELGRKSDGFTTTKKGEALYNARNAAYLKDWPMMRKYLRDFYKAGGTDEGLEASMKSIDPLSGLNEDEQTMFIRSLNADERAALRNAIKFAEKVKARFDF